MPGASRCDRFAPHLTGRAAVALACLISGPARATVTEPNGVVVPTDDTGGGEMRLDAFFAAEGETIDWRADAFSTPATFSPLCGFRATLKRVDSGSKYGVGWYNVVPNATTPPTSVFPIIPQNATPGQVFTGDDIRSSPDYSGGLIGFALIRNGTPAYHYSENQWNILCDTPFLCAIPGPWTLSLTYQSKTLPNAWYMGFEDGSTNNATWGNDGDFNDSLFLFEGLTCAGGGEPCEVPDIEGVCKAGLTECAGSGTLSCKQVVLPDTEKCDGIDNDCEGGIDEGGDLCPAGELCFQGSCVPNCGLAEFPCRNRKVCVQGVCVDPACADKSCEDGQACIDGVCVAPCDGVVCPGQQECLLGRCIDLCTGVTCEGGRVCEGGVCVESCDCRGCSSALACQSGSHPAAGRCVPPGCLDRTCAPGEACTAGSNGTCALLCGPNVVCPRGQSCSAGACVPAADVDGGSGSGGGTGAGGVIFVTSGGGPGAGGASSSGGSTANGPDAGTPGDGAGAQAADKLGCGCHVADAPKSPLARLGALLMLGVFAAWRRGGAARHARVAPRSHGGRSSFGA